MIPLPARTRRAWVRHGNVGWWYEVARNGGRLDDWQYFARQRYPELADLDDIELALCKTHRPWGLDGPLPEAERTDAIETYRQAAGDSDGGVDDPYLRDAIEFREWVAEVAPWRTEALDALDAAMASYAADEITASQLEDTTYRYRTELTE